MKAIKDNKVYTVDEMTKAEYLARGFDICADDGKVIERSPSSTVSRREYDELLARYEALKETVGDGVPDVPTGENVPGVPKKGKNNVSESK